MFPLIVADIGGTNARFGLVLDFGTQSSKMSVVDQHSYNCSEYPDFSSILHEYLSTITHQTPKNMCVAIAGPVTGDMVKMTNLNWSFSINKTQSEFDFEHLSVINDFAALALSVTKLDHSDLLSVKPGTPLENAPKVIIGPGTGLGVGSLVYTGSKWIPVAGEGGHANFAPSSPLEIELFKILRNNDEYVSLETLLSGNGIVRMYEAISEISGKIIEPDFPRLAENITNSALEQSDPIALDTLMVFCRILGSAAGNVALTVGARGGVYLAGGILPRIPSILLDSQFCQSFTSKGVMQDYAKAIPSFLITHKQPALLGAAAFIQNKL